MTCGHRTVLLAVSALSCALLQSVVAAQQPAPTAQTPAPPGQTPAPAARADSRFLAQGFSVVLVLADLQASTAPDDVPPAARRALADMKDFLPYKSYKLLDAAWILGQGTTGTTTRLRGPEEQEYELRMSTQLSSPTRSFTSTPDAQGARTTTNTTVFVRFTLNEAMSSEIAHVEAALAQEARRSTETTRASQEREIVRLEAELRAAEQQKNETKARELRAALARARNRPDRSAQATRPPSKRFSGTIIDTSFNMEVGETVVVGTSRLQGNSRALIALLTAVPVKGSRLPSESR
jgi:hypothetical protein